LNYLKQLNQWQQWVVGIGASLGAAVIVWLWRKLFGTGKMSNGLSHVAAPVMTQTFQPTINIHQTLETPKAVEADKTQSSVVPPREEASRSIFPRLVIDFEGTASNIVHTEHMRGATLASMIYVRVRVQNKGSSVANTCRVYLIGLKEVYPGGGMLPTALDDTKILAWAGWTFTPIDVPPDGVFFADVVRISKHEPGWLLCVDNILATQQKLKDYVGTYRFRIMVAADNAEYSFFELDVYYNGDWHSLRAIPVKSQHCEEP
jgi:hypothetical protein